MCQELHKEAKMDLSVTEASCFLMRLLGNCRLTAGKLESLYVLWLKAWFAAINISTF